MSHVPFRGKMQKKSLAVAVFVRFMKGCGADLTILEGTGGQDMHVWKNEKVKNAVMLGTLCSVLYLSVYFARNILGAVTPQILEEGRFSTEYI